MLSSVGWCTKLTSGPPEIDSADQSMASSSFHSALNQRYQGPAWLTAGNWSRMPKAHSTR